VENNVNISSVSTLKSLFFRDILLFISFKTAWGQVRVDQSKREVCSEFSTPLYDKIIHTWHFFGVVLTLFP
jgi:hypothetical protein